MRRRKLIVGTIVIVVLLMWAAGVYVVEHFVTKYW